MAEKTEIAYCDSTKNFWIGCTYASAGCYHCYARAYALRYGWVKNWNGTEFHRTSAANWQQALTWQHQRWGECVHCHWRGRIRSLRCPSCGGELHPTRRRVFADSLTDLFVGGLDHTWLAEALALMHRCDNIIWLVLTKRPHNIVEWIEMTTGQPFERWSQYNQHIWLGASIESNEVMWRLENLADLGHPSFISAAPLLENVVFDARLLRKVRWLINEGESGRNARPFQAEWAYSCQDQAHAAGLPYFFKQAGNNSNLAVTGRGNQPGEWPARLQLQELPYFGD